MSSVIMLFRKKRKTASVHSFIAVIIFILYSCLMAGSVAASEPIRFITPAANQMVFSKKPVVECHIPVSFDKETLMVEFDYTDMTALIKITDTGFKLKPLQVIPPGTHSVTVSFLDSSNNEVSQTLQFDTRHTETFEQADSQNTISVNYRNVLKKLDDAGQRYMPSWTVTSNINSANTIAEGPYTLSLNTNLQYFDQQTGVDPPQEKGLEVIDYQFAGQYEKDGVRVAAALGDVYINETQNTVSVLSRRGGSLNVDVQNVYASGFVVRSDQAYGLDGEDGLEFDDTDHIYGATLGVRLFEEKLDIKSIYVKGGESNQDTSYGIWPAPGGTTGDVYGFEVKTDFFEQKLMTRLEYDRSDYDADTSDTQTSTADEAWLAGIEGTIDQFNYNLLYTHNGADFQVPGNYSIQSDREGVDASTGYTFDIQSINAFFAQHNDNVDSDPASETITYSRYGIEYSIYPDDLPSFSLMCERNSEESENEPAGTAETNTYVDQFSGTIQYDKDMWMVGLRPSYSQVNDRTADNYDSHTTDLQIYGSYSHDRFSLGPSFAWNISKDDSTDIKTDTLTSQLQFSVNIIEELTFGGNVSYTRMYSDDDSIDSDDYNGDVMLEYRFPNPIKGLISPAIILQATHQNNKDATISSESKETIIYLLFSADLNLSF